MNPLTGLLIFGITFVIVRLSTRAIFEQIAPPPPDASRWAWWGTYVSILLSIIVASAVLAAIDRRVQSRPRP